MKKKRNKIYKKLSTGILASSLILSIIGCSDKEEKSTPETVVVVETIVVTATPTPSLTPTNTPTPTETPTPTDIPTPTDMETEETPPTEYHSADEGIDATLDDLYNKINMINYKIDTFNFSKLKENAINYSKQLIDFIFYGSKINDITFDELKDETKEKIYTKLQKTDTLIMRFSPDYKEKIGEKYNLVKDFSSKTLEEAKEVFNNKIDININVNKKEKSKKLTKRK